jgi:hypothetical protein
MKARGDQSVTARILAPYAQKSIIKKQKMQADVFINLSGPPKE